MALTQPRIFLHLILALSLCLFVGVSTFAAEDNGVPLALLKQRQWGDLDRLMNRYLDEYKRNTDKEFDTTTAFDAISVKDPKIAHLFDEWILASPDSAAARLARGRYNYEMAWLARGGNYMAETPQEKISGMELHTNRSIDDLRRACELDPTQALYSRYLIQAFMTIGKRDDINKEYKRATALDGQVRGARYAYMYTLLPQWGGSYQEMEAFLNELKEMPNTPKTIKTKGILEALLYARKSDDFFRDGQFEQALTFANLAVLANREQSGLTQVGNALVKLNRHAEAIPVFTDAINLSPSTANELRGPRDRRAFAYKVLRQSKEAFDDYVILAEKDNSYAQYFLGFAYAKGWGGIKRNQAEGIKWLALAADKGHEGARKLLLEVRSQEIH